MNYPAEEAARHAASQISKLPLVVSWAGNGAAYPTVHQAELQTRAIVLPL